uniref:Uncharacterized protein n=1 Tax=Arundo donax TaxID=35708 RepID=A0A0A8ZGZ4_ARUDO
MRSSNSSLPRESGKTSTSQTVIAISTERARGRRPWRTPSWR